MKYRNIKNWDNPKDCESLLFFAQRLDEILFDYSLDTYKPPALNTPFLCREALKTINEIEKENIDSNNLAPILEELEWSIQNDPIAKEIIELNYQDLIPENKSKINIQNQKIHLEIISRSINPNIYLFKIQEKLIEAIKNNKKNSLDALMKNWVTTLINIGYSKRHIHINNLDFFFGTKNISNLDQIKEFLALFLPYTHSFQVYFKAHNNIRCYEKILNEYGITFFSEEDENYKDVSEKFNEISNPVKEDELIIHINDIDAYDHYSARKSAEENLENVRNLILLYSHKTPISWSEVSVSDQCCKDGIEHVINNQSSVRMIADLRPQIAAERIEYFIENIALRKGATLDRFNRIIGLHGLCAIQDAPETQLLNLWIYIETLIPSDSSKSKIENILKKSTPILNLIYTRKIIRNLLRDMLF